jgi:hypothetical protein
MKRKEARKLLGFNQKTLTPSRPSSFGGIISTNEGQPQTKAKPAQAGANLDSAPQNRKKPKANLDEDQRIATAGETVPIVFGKRTSGIGGVWLQPSLLKTGTELFVSKSLFAISQGRVDSDPQLDRAFIGKRPLRRLSNGTIQLAQQYSTAATLAASPTTCPIVGGGLWCDFNTVSFLGPLVPAEVGARVRIPFFDTLGSANAYFAFRFLWQGTGDTTNTTITLRYDPWQLTHSGTGEDVTDAYYNFVFAKYGEDPTNPIFTNPLSVIADFPGNPLFIDSPTLTGGQAVGTIDSSYFDQNGYIAPDPDFNAALNLGPGEFLILENVVVETVNTQDDPAEPASTGVLAGIQTEFILSPFADPDSVPTANNASYADVTFLTVTGTISASDDGGTFPATKQLSIYYANGIRVALYSGGLIDGEYARGPSNQFVDLLMYAFRLYRRTERADGSNVSRIALPVFVDNMPAIAAFCDEYKLHFNGVVDEAINIIDFAVTMAPFFLLSFLSVGGQYRLEPILPLTTDNEIDLTPITPVETFNEDNILPGTFSKSFRQAEDRRPFVAVMLYRESRPNRVSVQKTVEVAFSSTPIDAPQEQFDMTDFCTDPNHAAIYGKYQLARRLRITHSISFDTALVLTDMKPTQIIKVERQRISSKGDDRLEVDFYQITSITFNNDGTSAVEAEHFPLNNSGVARISNTVINGNFRVLS